MRVKFVFLGDEKVQSQNNWRQITVTDHNHNHRLLSPKDIYLLMNIHEVKNILL